MGGPLVLMSREVQPDGLFPQSAVGGSARTGRPEASEQLALLGEPSPVRVPAAQWAAWLSDPRTAERYRSKVYRTSLQDGCWFWIAGISSTGHGSFRAASLPGPSRRGTVPAHLFGYQAAHGVIPRLGWDSDSPTVCHTCDNHSCQQPTHLRLGNPAENRAEWAARRRTPGSPLADLRGPAARSRAIGTAIRVGLANGEAEPEIIHRIRLAADAGQPLGLW